MNVSVHGYRLWCMECMVLGFFDYLDGIDNTENVGSWLAF